MMKFGDFVRYRRENILKRDRTEIEFNDTYLASIETNKRRPTKPDVVNRLGKALGIYTNIGSDWLWYYSMSNKEPYPFPAMHTKTTVTDADLPTIFQTNTDSDNSKHIHAIIPATSHHPHHINETPLPYGDEIHIQLQASEEDVITRLGPPDKKIRVPARCKWIYEKEGLHVIFTDGKVTDIAFK